MGMWRSDDEEKQWSIVDTKNPHNRWNSQATEFKPISSNYGSGVFGLIGALVDLNRGAFGIMTKPSRYLWVVTTFISVAFIVHSAIGKEFTWDFKSLFAATIATIITLIIAGGLLSIPIIIFDYVIVRPLLWIIRKLNK